MQIIQSVPTNMITGFLGVGKTTAINHLLSSKPKNERWAVLVNEFGEIGVDASLIKSKSSSDTTFIREVTGGCMCCTSGLPMQIALNRLLSEAKPHRLLIEPTGMGHPKEMLTTLIQPHYQSVLKLQSTITLVNSLHLREERYTTNDIFNQQLAVADIIVGNKTDLYDENDQQNLIDYCKTFNPSQIKFVQNGQLDWQWLNQPNGFVSPQSQSHQSLLSSGMSDNNMIFEQDTQMPDCGFIVKENQQPDCQSIGWKFEPTFVFDHLKLAIFLTGLQVERAKGIFITSEGIIGFNKTPNGLTEISLDDTMFSSFEIIHPTIQKNTKDLWTQSLLDCLQ